MPKEESDEIEREFKFEPMAGERVLALLRPLLRPGWHLVKWPPRTVLDLYFDTPDFAMYRNSATLRLRKRKRAKGWTVNYKPPRGEETRYMARRQIRSTVSRREAMMYVSGELPGKAATLAYQDIGTHAASSDVQPTVHLVSARTCYTVRPGNIGDLESNLLNVMLESVVAYDMTKSEASLLIDTTFMDCLQPVPSVEFRNAEVEADGRHDGLEEVAVELMLNLRNELMRSDVALLDRSKYQCAAVALGIVGP